MAQSNCFVRVFSRPPLLTYQVAVEGVEKYSSYQCICYDEFSAKHLLRVWTNNDYVFFQLAAPSLAVDSNFGQVVRWRCHDIYKGCLVVYSVTVTTGPNASGAASIKVNSPQEHCVWARDVMLWPPGHSDVYSNRNHACIAIRFTSL